MNVSRTVWLIALLITTNCITGCASSFYKEVGKNTAIAAAYDQSDEKKRGVTQYEYEQEIKKNLAHQNDEEENLNPMRNQ